jgi:hypothetical protein
VTDERRCLILANQTLCGSQLMDAVRPRIAREEHEFLVVVPATPLTEQRAAPGKDAEDAVLSASQRAFALAQQRLDRALAEIRELGAEASGEVGDPDPLVAATVALHHFPADSVIVSTLPLGLSRWLRRDLPARVERATHLPVEHVVEPDRT